MVTTRGKSNLINCPVYIHSTPVHRLQRVVVGGDAGPGRGTPRLKGCIARSIRRRRSRARDLGVAIYDI